MAETTEKVSFQSLSAAAVRLGEEHGQAAAEWYWDSTTPDIYDYRKVLKGIDGGDPEVMDTLPRADLSGEMADGMTPNKLYEMIGVPEQFFHHELHTSLEEICDAYEQAFNGKAESVVRTSCEENLFREVRLEVSCATSVDADDLKLLVKDIEDVINKHNADFNGIEITDEETDDSITVED